MMLRALAFIVFVAFAGAASAGFMTGNNLLENCGNNSANWYIMGAIDQDAWETIAVDRKTGAVFEKKPFVCIPAGVTGTQAGDVVCKYLRDHPENRQWNAAALIRQSLASTWACPQ